MRRRQLKQALTLPHSPAPPRRQQGNQPRNKNRKKWLWPLLAAIAVAVIVAAVVGGVVGSRAANKNNSSSSAAAKSAASAASTAAASKTQGSGKDAVVPTATDQFGNPLYPSQTLGASISQPTVKANSSLAYPADPYNFGTSSTLQVRDEHPMLYAPAYKWSRLLELIPQDSYLSSWNATIANNATKFYNEDPTPYDIDGCLSCSGVLDVSRQVQMKVKHWAYMYKVTNDTKWVTRTWTELQTAANNNSAVAYGNNGDPWNSAHFLDLAEFTTTFAIAYDWLYDAWTPSQRQAIMWSILNLGLHYGDQAYTNASSVSYGWWTTTNGNWNCVCNNGLTMGALAIYNEDPTGLAKKILGYTVANAPNNCGMASSSDGSWSETANYWYFGTYAHASMSAALISATGSDQNLLTSNAGTKLSGKFHMAITGHQGLFDYGDCGPNKYSTNANAMLLYGDQFSLPQYTLFQRDRGDVAEPMAMLYYNPEVSGQFWDGLALDYHFDNATDAWVSMRSSWTDNNGLYVAMKTGELTGHQTHGDLDAGDFVVDALGQRFFGELGSGNYLADGYFTSEGQNAERWDYYRKRTEGQNTLLMAGLDQNVSGVIPATAFGTTGENQTSLVYTPSNSSTAYYSADLTEIYNGSSTLRAVRLLNGRRQVLLQDEVNVPAAGVQWRAHTNATITLSGGNRTATLDLGGQKMVVNLLQPTGATFGTAQPVRLGTDPTLPTDSESADQANPGVTVLTINLDQGQQTIEVLMNPQWAGFGASSFVTPPSVAIAQWSTTSHDD